MRESMDIKQRQRLERNKLTFNLGLIILGLLNILTLLGFVDVTANKPLVLVRTIINVIVLIVFFIGHAKYKGDTKFIGISLSCMIITYAVMIISNRHVYFYAFMYLIMMAVMLYMDVRLARVCAVVLAILNIIAGVVHYVTYPEMQTECVLQMAFAIAFGVVSCIVINMQAKHAKEDTEAIRNQMDVAARVASQIIEMSETLAQKFDSARDMAETLTESMTSSNNSVKEIASSVKLTAEAIE